MSQGKEKPKVRKSFLSDRFVNFTSSSCKLLLALDANALAMAMAMAKVLAIIEGGWPGFVWPALKCMEER